MILCKRHPKGITKADSEAQKAENLINQDFTAQSPNEKWLMDITEIPCKNGKLYLAPVLDCYDGSIRGFKWIPI
jgi:putative transposase